MTTFNLRLHEGGGTRKQQVEDRVRELVIGAKPTPLPKLHIRSYTDENQEVSKVDVDFSPENKSPSGGSTRGIMRGAR